jgi:glyoxylase-like metal-dependent hydrolase (beta-lactamase superfamily II)
MWRFLTCSVFAGLLYLAAQKHSQTVTEVAPGVFFWEGDHLLRKPANCVWIVFESYVLVIDSNFPWGAREILPEIKRTTNKPIRFLFNTHYHSDHTFGNSLFFDAGATIICSEECAQELRTKGKSSWERFRNEPPRTLEGLTLQYPTLLFKERMVFDDGQRRVELIRVGPAHSRGDAVAYLPDEKILITGDLSVNWAWGNNVADIDADHDNWVRVLGQLEKWNVKTVIPGHGSLGGLSVLRGQREYLADMVAKVREGDRAGKSAEELVRDIDLSKHGQFAANPNNTANSIRAIHRKVSGELR